MSAMVLPGGRVRLEGELDMATAPQLGGLAADLLTTGEWDGVLDVSGLRFIDAAGLGELTKIARALRNRGTSLTVTGASPRIRRVFAVTGLGGLLAAE